jgi:hypothetical protein
VTAGPCARRRVGEFVVVTVGIAILASCLGSGTAHSTAVALAAAGPSSFPCPGPRQPTNYSGALQLDGGPLGAASADGVAIAYSYFVQAEVVANAGGEPILHCIAYDGTTTTGADGSFSFATSIPPTDCVSGPGGYCVYFTGPFPLVTASPAQPAPAGYAVTTNRTRTVFDFTFVWELSSVTLAPAGSQFVLPPNDPVTFAASAWSANGSAAPFAPQFGWTLDGVGWSFADPPHNGSAAVIAVAGASVATLTVDASAVVDGTVVSAPAVTATLVAVTTLPEGGELNRTTVDAGASVAARLTAVGAAGYAYAATIAPGLDLPAVAASCGTSPDEPGTVFVSCSTNLTYPDPGVAQPTANLTNAFSAATWFFPDVTVDPPPVLTVGPGGPTGYVGSPVPIDLSAAPGSGATPYAEACLAVPGSDPTCEPTPGPLWRFAPTFGRAGEFPAVAWAVDADATNRSVGFSIDVVPPLVVGPVELGSGNASVGEAVRLTATVAGGDLPARFWWNATGVPGPLLAGTTDSDGPTTVTFVPSAIGSTEVSFVAVDALGTVAEADRIVAVGPSAVASVAPVTTPPPTALPVGTPIPVAWAAFDAAGATVRAFGAPVELELTGPQAAAASLWVNASGSGPLPGNAGDGFDVPASAWVEGVLNLSITLATAGSFGLTLVGSALPDAVPPLALVGVPDTRHVALYDPVVSGRSPRADSTFWLVRDRFGNPAPGAVLTVRCDWGGTSSASVLVSGLEPNGTSGVWINYSAPGAAGGTVTVYDAAGSVLIGPVAIPAAPAGVAAVEPVALLGGVVGLGAAGAAMLSYRRRRSRSSSSPTGGEEELRRLAEGRAAVVEIVRAAGPVDLRALEAAWSPPPAPPDLADWVASLVTDGTLGAELGTDGTARFCVPPGAAEEPTVTFDSAALDEAVRRREAALRDDTDPP